MQNRNAKLKTEMQNRKQKCKTENRNAKQKTEIWNLKCKTENRNAKQKTENRNAKLKTEFWNAKQKCKTENRNPKQKTEIQNCSSKKLVFQNSCFHFLTELQNRNMKSFPTMQACKFSLSPKVCTPQFFICKFAKSRTLVFHHHKKPSPNNITHQTQFWNSLSEGVNLGGFLKPTNLGGFLEPTNLGGFLDNFNSKKQPHI